MWLEWKSDVHVWNGMGTQVEGGEGVVFHP